MKTKRKRSLKKILYNSNTRTPDNDGGRIGAGEKQEYTQIISTGLRQGIIKFGEGIGEFNPSTPEIDFGRTQWLVRDAKFPLIKNKI